MIKSLLLPAMLLIAATAFGQTAGTDKYRSVSDSTGTLKAWYLTSDTLRINNPSLLPPGTAVPLYDENEKLVAQYVLTRERTWIFVSNKKD